MSVLRLAAHGAGVLAMLGLSGGYMGSLHPAGDALAVLRPALAMALAGLALMAFAFGAQHRGAVVLVAALFALGPIAIGMARTPRLGDQPEVTVYSKNLWAGLTELGPMLADIRAVSPDLVLLQEVSDTNLDLLRALSADYPHQHLCRFSGWSGIAILSRWPLEDPRCSRRRVAALARVAAPDGALWAGSVHQVWPYPRAQAAFLHDALPLLARVEGRAVIAGDFNMMPWGWSVSRIASVTGTRRIGRIMGTFEWHGVPLPIDHVLTSGHGETERRPLLGSDHYGVVARIAF